MNREERAAEILTRFTEELDDGRSPDAEALLLANPELEDLLRGPLAQELRLARARPAGPIGAAARDSDAAEVERVGQFRVVRELGRGGQGVVYLAEDTQLPRLVALKLLRAPLAPSPQARARFRREAQITAKLDHPGICSVYQADIDGDPPHIVMRYVEGQSLAQLIESARSLRTPGRIQPHIELARGNDDADSDSAGVVRIVAMAEKVARALHTAHESGLVHRDIKPGNIMITPKGDPVILDFGLARDDVGPSMTLTGTSVGTPEYMSPEQIDPTVHEVGAGTDVYSLGVTLFECLTLRRPFASPTREGLYHQILTGDAESVRRLNPSISRDLDVVVATALQRDRTRRYSTALAFAEDLLRVRTREPILARPEAGYRRLWRSATRHPVVAVLLFLCLVAPPGLWQWSRAKDRDAAIAQIERDRAAASERLDAYRDAQTRLDRARLSLRDALTRSAFPPNAERTQTIFDAEKAIRTSRFDAARALADAESSVERAATVEAGYGAVSEATDILRVEVAFTRYTAAVADRDSTAVAVRLETLRNLDKTRLHIDAITGDGTLRVACAPSDAEVLLYRYISYEALRAPEAVVPRLVPVPWSSRGECRSYPWVPGFGPGDPCLVVRSVAAGSPAATQGVEPGDLVLQVQGAPCGDGLFVSRVVPAGLAERLGVRPWWRVGGIDQVHVRSRFEWTYSSGGSTSVVTIRDRTIPVPVGGGREESMGISVLAPSDLLRTPAPEEGASLTVLRRGVACEVRVRAGEVAGIDPEVTAYPLIISDENIVAAGGGTVSLPPGGYLLLARAKGFESQVYPVLVKAGSLITASIDLLPAGTTPPGFVWIPRGTSRIGGDPDRDDGVDATYAAKDVDVPGFFIRRCEISTREWFTFVNRPESLAKIEQARADGRTVLLPRHYDDPKPFARRRSDGTWEPTKAADGPVLGVTRDDVVAFLEFHNQNVRARGERWLWELPTPTQIERAARGADGRLYPWGDRYDEDLCVNLAARPAYLHDMPSQFEPRDESPFGVADLAGSRREMCDGNKMLGGSWADADPRLSRVSYGEGYGPGWLNWSVGFRVVLVPNPDARPAPSSEGGGR